MTVPLAAAPPTLLIVDDNRALAENLEDIFVPRGFSVRFTPSAQEALDLARDFGFDLALVDVNLPDARGTDLLPALRDAVPTGEVVVITGHATIDSAVAAVRGGAFHYVVKPFKVEDLVATVESALRQSALRKDRQALLAQLASSERRYRDVVESTQVVVVGLDADAVVRLFNRRAAEVSGFAPEEVLGASFLDTLVPPEARSEMVERLRAAHRGRAHDEFEAPLLTHDGRARTVLWHAAGATASSTDHDPLSVYMVGTDATERRALERRAAEAEALAHMGTLAAGLAHEIRNPLNAALLQLHLLGRGVARLPEPQRPPLVDRIHIVESELRRLERLLSDFLELARPRPMAREPIDLPALLQDVLDLHEPMAAARGVSLVCRVMEAWAVGDRERLKQVFHNLLLNALEATAPGGAVTVGCARDEHRDDMVCVRFSDTGRGIPRGAMEKVFEPFFTTKEAGTGLGLSIVRQIAERHGGRVELESVEGKGTRIGVCLPASHAPTRRSERP